MGEFPAYGLRKCHLPGTQTQAPPVDFGLLAVSLLWL